MSLQAMAWAKKVTHDPEGKKLHRTQKFVLVMLADEHNEHTQIAAPSLKELMSECLISKPSLVAALKALETKGLITVSKTVDERGWSLRNEYAFPALTDELARGNVALPLPQDVGSKATLPGGKVSEPPRGKATLPQEKSSSPTPMTVPEEELGKRGGADEGTTHKNHKATPEDLRDAYAAECTKLTPCLTLTEKRRRKAAVRLREHDLPWWTETFRGANRIAFLSGTNQRGWVATFDWLIANEENAIKVREGQYGKFPTPPAPRPPVAKSKEKPPYHPTAKEVENVKRLRDRGFKLPSALDEVLDRAAVHMPAPPGDLANDSGSGSFLA